MHKLKYFLYVVIIVLMIYLTRASLENYARREVQFCQWAKDPRAELDFLRVSFSNDFQKCTFFSIFI